MPPKTLTQIVAEQPFPDYAAWWPLGPDFLAFMSKAIVSQWADLPHPDGILQTVTGYVSEYLSLVYGQTVRPDLVETFMHRPGAGDIQSGEFDALSYAFFRSAFEQLQRQPDDADRSPKQARRHFTQRVGRLFFRSVHTHLALDLPPDLTNEPSFNRLKQCLHQIGDFLREQGYLRDHFAFSFLVEAVHAGCPIRQAETEFLHHLHHHGRAYAIYEMGYPVILPSAVYLYHTLGEAQHHSSRTIEELFDRIGYQARETDEFDPIDYPSDRVVELWEIRKTSIIDPPNFLL